MNFKRLVLGCIDVDFGKQMFVGIAIVGKLLTRSTRFGCFCTAQTSIFSKMSSKMLAFSKLEMLKHLHFIQISSRFSLILMKFGRIFSDFVEKLNAEKRCNFSKKFNFKLIFHHDYTGDFFNFRLNFRFKFI